VIGIANCADIKLKANDAEHQCHSKGYR